MPTFMVPLLIFGVLCVVAYILMARERTPKPIPMWRVEHRPTKRGYCDHCGHHQRDARVMVYLVKQGESSVVVGEGIDSTMPAAEFEAALDAALEDAEEKASTLNARAA